MDAGKEHRPLPPPTLLSLSPARAGQPGAPVVQVGGGGLGRGWVVGLGNRRQMPKCPPRGRQGRKGL